MSSHSSLGLTCEGMSESNLIVFHGGSSKSWPLGIFVGVSEVYESHLVPFFELGHLLFSCEFFGYCSCALLDPSLDLGSFPPSIELNGFSIYKEFDTGVATNSEPLSQFSFNSGINLGKFGIRPLLLELF